MAAKILRIWDERVEGKPSLDVLRTSKSKGYGKLHLFTMIFWDLQERVSKLTKDLIRTPIANYLFEEGSPSQVAA